MDVQLVWDGADRHGTTCFIRARQEGKEILLKLFTGDEDGDQARAVMTEIMARVHAANPKTAEATATA